MATKCLDVLAKYIIDEKSKAACMIRTCFYMNDLLTGADTVVAAIQLCQNIHNSLAFGHFSLKKYTSNY